MQATSNCELHKANASHETLSTKQHQNRLKYRNKNKWPNVREREVIMKSQNRRMKFSTIPSLFSWPNDVKDIWNIWKSDWSLKEQATLRWCVEGNPGLGWYFKCKEHTKGCQWAYQNGNNSKKKNSSSNKITNNDNEEKEQKFLL